MFITKIWSILTASPWKVWNEVWRLLCLPCVRWHFWINGIHWGKNWKIYGLPLIQKYRGSRIEIGDNLELRSTVSSNPLSPFHPVVISTRSKEASLVIGDTFRMTGGSVVATNSIRIGNRVTVGANSAIFDTDFHPIDAATRREQFVTTTGKPVVIGDDVFIGTRSLLLKGVKIGQGAVVGAGSVVVQPVAKQTVVAGNPARLLKRL